MGIREVARRGGKKKGSRGGMRGGGGRDLGGTRPTCKFRLMEKLWLLCFFLLGRVQPRLTLIGVDLR